MPARALSHPATVLRRPNTTLPRKRGNPRTYERRERERERDATKQHYPAIKRRVLSTVRSFFFSSLQRASRYMPVSVTNSIVFLRSTTKGCRPSTSQTSRTSVRRPTSIRNICIINRAPHAVPISSASPPVRAGGGDNK